MLQSGPPLFHAGNRLNEHQPNSEQNGHQKDPVFHLTEEDDEELVPQEIWALAHFPGDYVAKVSLRRLKRGQWAAPQLRRAGPRGRNDVRFCSCGASIRVLAGGG